MELTRSLLAIRKGAAHIRRSAVHQSYDVLDRLTGSRGPLVPPRRMNPNLGFTPQRGAYEPQFIASGEAIAEMLVAYGGLSPVSAVLDIGSGIGRVARALTARLGPSGSYRAFDPDQRSISWCQSAYQMFPNFDFLYAPLTYVNVPHQAEQGLAEDYRFPYDESTFDLVFSISVYTHLSFPAVARYLAESRRVLRPGGLTINTFFVLDDFALRAIEAGTADRAYRQTAPGIYMEDPSDPNTGIAFGEEAVKSLHTENGLEIVPPVHFGTWSGRPVGSFIYQDVVVARPAVSSTD